MGIDTSTLDVDRNQFMVYFDSGDLLVTLDVIAEVTQISSLPQHPASLPLFDCMTIVGVRCTQLDPVIKASTMFHNVHCVGRWIQCNIPGLDHTTSFNRPTLQIIHSLMYRQHLVCLNTTIMQSLISYSQRNRGVKYSHPVSVCA